MSPLVIIGAGLAGYTVLREFRKRDSTTPVTLITADEGDFYAKPNLSSALGAGKSAAQLVNAPRQKMAADLSAEIRPNTRVMAIDPARHRLQLADGELSYGRLVLALGADPIAHGLPGEGADRVFAVNDLADYAAFRDALLPGARVLILGGGLIGCEFANDLVGAGHGVEVVHAGAQPLDRLLPAEAGAHLAAGLAAAGVVWHRQRRALAVHRQGAGVVLELDNGQRIEADLVLSAIGLRPRTQLAASAGLDVARGIRVDRLLASSQANIYALGDCAEVEGLVLPYVLPLMASARALAATLTGTSTPVVYPAMPVVVKTPAHPVVVLPPPAGTPGDWAVTTGETGVCALYTAADGHLSGFALTGSETARRAQLARDVPGWLV
jgi:rubredoxin-NAD+ reductase